MKKYSVFPYVISEWYFLATPIKLGRVVTKFTTGNRTGTGIHHSTCPPFPSGCDHLLAAISHFFPFIQAGVHPFPSPDTFLLSWVPMMFAICDHSVIHDSFSLLFAARKQLGGSMGEKKKIPNNPALSSHAWHNCRHKRATAGKVLFSPVTTVLDVGAMVLQGAVAM